MRKGNKVSKKEILVRLVCFFSILLTVGIGFVIWNFSQMFHMDVPTFTTWDDENRCFSYHGKQYYEIEAGNHYIQYEKNEELGRIKNKSIVIYTVKGDSENSILIGQTIQETYIYSWKYKEIPKSGKVTMVSLTDRNTYDGESKILYIEDKKRLKLLKDIKNAKGEKITFSKQEMDGNMVEMHFYFEGCTVTYSDNDISADILRFENGEWACGNFDENSWTGRKIEGKQEIVLLESLAKEISGWKHEVRKEESKKE